MTCFQMYKDYNIRPYGLGFTPINPYFGIDLFLLDDYREEKLVRQIPKRPMGDKYLKEIAITSEDIELLHPEVRILKDLDIPFLTKQYIGRFPEEILPVERFDIVRDSKGPIYYWENAYSPAYSLLKEDGVLYCFCLTANWLENVTKQTSPQDLIIAMEHYVSRDMLSHNLRGEYELLVIKAENPLAKKIKHNNGEPIILKEGKLEEWIEQRKLESRTV